MDKKDEDLLLQVMSEAMNGSDPDGDMEKMYIPYDFAERYRMELEKEFRKSDSTLTFLLLSRWAKKAKDRLQHNVMVMDSVIHMYADIACDEGKVELVHELIEANGGMLAFLATQLRYNRELLNSFKGLAKEFDIEQKPVVQVAKEIADAMGGKPCSEQLTGCAKTELKDMCYYCLVAELTHRIRATNEKEERIVNAEKLYEAMGVEK